MKRALTVAAWFALTLCVSTIELNGQTPTPTPPVDIIYTGKLFGYFRSPSLQKFNQPKGCPARSDADSDAAKIFFQHQRNKNSILVATGDNFAPQLEARMFENPPQPAGGEYAAGNKELFVFDDKTGWIPYDSKNANQSLLQRIADGYGTIPTDNVACFLRAAKFDAIVPGKHDFYFGPERLRQLARFLAATSTENDSQPVQMLGANLVLKTSSLGTSDSAKVDQPGIGGWPDDYKVMNLKEGNSVYPWFTYVKIKPETDPDKDVRKNKIFLCLSKGGPNEIPEDFEKDCEPLEWELRRVDDVEVVFVKIPDLKSPHIKNPKNGHHFKLLAGKNYGLCTRKPPKKAGDPEKRCLRFSSYTPFFYFPHEVPQVNTDSYTDPDPYVLRDRVAIFGAVDPKLNEQVGILNLGWKNDRDGFTSRVSAEDPADALQQQLDYFESRHKDFNGLKVLLAQMDPQHARALATRLPDFQMVVSAADRDQATDEVTMSTVWDLNRRRAFVAVPAPYYNLRKQQGFVHFGTVRASEVTAKTFELATQNTDPVVVPEPEDPAEDFWRKISSSKKCFPADFDVPDVSKDPEKRMKRLKLLVLCTMRDKFSGAVALIQTQDLFDKIPLSPKHLPKRQDPGDSVEKVTLKNFQQTLDRLIWKGDLLLLSLIRGADLKKALDKSDQYAAEETASLSLSVDRGRQLERLGVRKENGEYFINDLPLKDTESYPVVTTDFIGAGDTGYPDLATAALNKRTHPKAFTGDLIPISGLVCRWLLEDADEASKYCLGPLNSDKYLDHTTAKQIDPLKQPGFFKKVEKFFAAGWPDGATAPTDDAEAIEQTVQRRDTWRLTLQNLSFGYKGVDNNMSDDEIKEKFSGIQTSGVTATEKQSFNFAFNARLSRSSHKRELFVEPRFEYEREYLGDDPDDRLDTNQLKNKATLEAGYVFWRRPGRAVPNLGANVSLYLETQVQHPFSVFALATSDDRIRIDRERSLTVMPRIGFRWQARTNYWELGIQGGKEFDAPNGYRFITNGVVVDCPPNALQSFGDCVKANSDPAKGGSITEDSEKISLTATRPRAGFYGKLGFSRPLGPRVKYELDGTGDYFIFNFPQDTTIDTRFKFDLKHRLSFVLFPSVSIGPTWDMLLYKNKRNKDFLFQKNLGVELKFSFDVFNRRDIGTQLSNKP